MTTLGRLARLVTSLECNEDSTTGRGTEVVNNRNKYMI